MVATVLLTTLLSLTASADATSQIAAPGPAAPEPAPACQLATATDPAPAGPSAPAPAVTDGEQQAIFQAGSCSEGQHRLVPTGVCCPDNFKEVDHFVCQNGQWVFVETFCAFEACPAFP